MKRLLPVALCLLAALAATARGDLKLEVGKTTPVKLRIINHNAEPIENLRIRMSTNRAWLEVAMPDELEVTGKDEDDKPTVWAIDKVAPGSDGGLELTLKVTISSTPEAPSDAERGDLATPKDDDKKDDKKKDGKETKGGQPPGDKGDEGDKGKEADKAKKAKAGAESPVGQFGHIVFVVWRSDENPGQEKKNSKEAGDKLGVPPWRSWEIDYLVAATYPELAEPPTDMEWHMADAKRGATGRQIQMTIHNKSKFKPLLNLMVIPAVPPGPITVSEATAEEKIVVNNVQGMKVIEEDDKGTFDITFSVSKDAKPGQTGQIRFWVRTSTMGARPNPWDPALLVNITARQTGLEGNFEAFVYYNLPPPKDKKDKDTGPKGVDESTWMPVPKGTKLTIMQIYMLRAAGQQKPVEQMVGYGNVIDDKGYAICKVNPEKQHPMRFRIVAETMANVMELEYKDAEKTEVVGVRKKGSRAAVTPFGRRVFRCISHPFVVEQEEELSLLEKKRDKGGEGGAGAPAADGAEPPAGPKAGKKRKFYRAKSGQSRNFIVDDKVLLPYYGYGHDVDPKRRPPKGILIKWEGELSTGGHINHFDQYPTTFSTDNALGRMEAFTQTQVAKTGYGQDYAQELTLATNLPGLIYHNHNELLHVLAALIRAQDFCANLDFFRSTKPRKRPDAEKKGEAEEEAKKEGEAGNDAGGQAPQGAKVEGDERTPPKLPGVVAYWRKGARIEGGETGYALFKDPRRKDDKGVWRLMVQGYPEDPDERDIGLVLRGYGAALRRKFWVRQAEETEEEQAKPTYAYYKRTSIDEAWKQGFDIFFAAAVLNSPKVANRVAVEAKARNTRSVDLEEIVTEASQAQGKRIYRQKYHRLRGADNAVAVAAGLWQAAKALSAERLIDEILYEEGGSFLWFLNLVRREKPDLLKDFMALGLCPVVERFPPPASLKGSVSPEAVRVFWHPNDMVEAVGKLKATMIFASPSDEKTTRIEMKGGKDPKAAREYPFGELLDGEKGEAQLASKLRDGEKLFWTVETTLGKASNGKKEHYAFKWPLQDFTAEFGATATGDRDRTLYANSRSKMTVSKGAANSTDIDNRTIHSVLGGRKVLGGAVYTVRIHEPAPDAPAPDRFAKPVRLALRWREGEDPGDASPGIYFRNPDTNRWEMVGNKRTGTREVEAAITRAGNYALMVDHLPPQVESLIDVPDPFPTTVEGLQWKLMGQLSEPATLSVTIEDGGGKVLRTLLKDAKKPVGPLEIAWDGKDDAGKPLPDGTYTYRLLATDESKRKAPPATGKVTVLSGDMGSAEGTVKLAAESKGAPRVEVVGTTLSAECEDDGSYWLLGLTEGAHTFRFRASGHFEEHRQVELKAKGGELKLEPVTLTNVALKGLRASSEVFTPDGDGERDYVSLTFTMVRECPLDVGVYDADGDLVSGLQVGKKMTKGEAVVLWQGTDDDETPQPSGWYTIRLIARSRTEGIPQGDIKVLLDRGLVRNAHAFPSTFSPNGDGFDDELEIGYTLDDDALVTIRVLRQDGSLLKEILSDKKQPKGWTVVTWDGKGPDGKVVRDGKYVLEIRPKYLSGHESIVVREEFMADSLPPEVGEAKPPNGSIVRTGMPTISARILSDLADVAASQLKIKIDENTVLADNYDEKTGVFSFTPKTSLGEGVHIAIAYAQDLAGNYAPPQAVSFKVQLGEAEKKFIDRTKPEVLELKPSKGDIVYTPTPLVTARVRDADSGIDPSNIVVYFNGERVSNAVRMFIPGKSGKPWDWYYYEKSIVLYDPLEGDVRYVPIEPLREGKNHVSLEVLDRQGNKSKRAEAVFEVVVDNDPPAITKLAPANGATLAKPDVVVTATLADVGRSGLALDTLRFALDGKQVALDTSTLRFDEKTGVLTLPLDSPLARDAQHAVLLTVRDRAGNISKPASSVFSIVEDGEPPRIDIVSRRPEGPVPAKQPVLLAAAVYDVGRSGIDATTISLTLDGKPVPADDRDTAAVEGYLLTRGLLTRKFEGLAPGRHVVALGVQDKAGNKSSDVVWQFEVK